MKFIYICKDKIYNKLSDISGEVMVTIVPISNRENQYGENEYQDITLNNGIIKPIDRYHNYIDKLDQAKPVTIVYKYLDMYFTDRNDILEYVKSNIKSLEITRKGRDIGGEYKTNHPYHLYM